MSECANYINTPVFIHSSSPTHCYKYLTSPFAVCGHGYAAISSANLQLFGGLAKCHNGKVAMLVAFLHACLPQSNYYFLEG